jgi:hypothetical protein
MKTCSKCGVRQPNSEFPYREGTRREGYCRECGAAEVNNSRAGQSPEALLERREREKSRRPAGWYEALPPEKKEERRNATRHYYDQNREKVLARVAARRAARRAAMGIKLKVIVWRDEVIDTLRKLQAEGLSASQIALHLNQAFEISLTRNAVIGKLHRMGLSSGKRPDAAEPRAQALAS